VITFRSDERGRETRVGVAWYRPEQWQRLREISIDKDVLEETHAEWVQNAERAVQELRRQGMNPVKVDVDVEELLQWCASRHVAVNGEARSTYVAAKLERILDEKHDSGD
jgi:Asp-tRNA(Asn)/Glu-tRNA(Gln) amidotransferase A subunit family amidase